MPPGSLSAMARFSMLGTDVKVGVGHFRDLEVMALLVVLIDDIREDDVACTGRDEVTDEVRACVACREVELEGAGTTLVAALIALVVDVRRYRAVLPRECHLAIGTTLTCDIGRPPETGRRGVVAVAPEVAFAEHPSLGVVGCGRILRVAAGDELDLSRCICISLSCVRAEVDGLLVAGCIHDVHGELLRSVKTVGCQRADVLVERRCAKFSFVL